MKGKFLLLVFAVILIISCKEVERKQPPNFIVFIADDAAWNDCGPYGNMQIKTPNINKLAEEALVFNSAFLTTSSCSPSRCSILTGRYPHSTGAPELHMPLPANQLLFAGLPWHGLALLGFALRFRGSAWLIGRHGSVSFSIGNTGPIWLSGITTRLRLLPPRRQLITCNPWCVFKAIMADLATLKKCSRSGLCC